MCRRPEFTAGFKGTFVGSGFSTEVGNLNFCVHSTPLEGSTGRAGRWLHGCVRAADKLQELVYDILPPTTAIIGYAIGLLKLS